MKRRNMIQMMGALSLLILSSLLQAQDPGIPAYQDLEFPPTPQVELPTVDSFKLSNGMTVYLLEDHELPLIGGSALGAVLGGGAEALIVFPAVTAGVTAVGWIELAAVARRQHDRDHHRRHDGRSDRRPQQGLRLLRRRRRHRRPT